MPTVEQILDNYVQAIGGAVAYTRLRSRVMRGRFELTDEGVAGTIEQEAIAPNRLRMSFTGHTTKGDPFDFLRVFDGASAWEFDSTHGVHRDLGGTELLEMRRNAEFYRDINLGAFYPKMTFKGKTRTGTCTAYAIEATPTEGDPEDWYFNTRTGLLVRMDDTYFDDYREVDGVTLPFVIRASSEAGRFVAEFDDIRHNGQIDTDGFRSQDPSLAAATTDEYIHDEMTKRRIPGLALVAIKNGDIVKMNGYGVANLEHDIPVTPDTVFELASVSKQFTATAIMRLVELGKLRPDDGIVRYLPRSPRKWRGITVRHLLTHTSGMIGSLDDGLFLALGEKTDVTTEEDFGAIAKDPIGFAPGQRFRYSDAGYFLLGMIIETASGHSYRDSMAEQLFRPLGMTSTSIINQWTVVKHRAAGYTIRDGQVSHIRHIQQADMPSHWGVLSTVRDMATWDRALAAGTVVKESTLHEMWAPVRLNNGQPYPYGYGWEVEQIAGRRMITHPGLSGTEYTILPDDKLTIIVLTNLGGYLDFTEVGSWGLTRGLARRWLSGLP